MYNTSFGLYNMLVSSWVNVSGWTWQHAPIHPSSLWHTNWMIPTEWKVVKNIRSRVHSHVHAHTHTTHLLATL